MATKDTDARLLDVAIEHFGRLGIDGASTRAIAKDATTPMSSITYHFGGKEGLYLATAERVAERMGEQLAPAIAEAERACQPGCTPTRARQALHSVYSHLAAVMVRAETAPLARFIIREQADPTAAFSRIYERLMSPMLTRMNQLLGSISGGKLDPSEARVHSISLFGQVLVFRVARETALRGAGWKSIGSSELEIIQKVLGEHLDGALDRIARGTARRRSP